MASASLVTAAVGCVAEPGALGGAEFAPPEPPPQALKANPATATPIGINFAMQHPQMRHGSKRFVSSLIHSQLLKDARAGDARRVLQWNYREFAIL
jgi:hypothetical protein